MKLSRFFWVLLTVCGLAGNARAVDELAHGRTHDGSSVAYVLTTNASRPLYGVILMPGGSGIMSPRLDNNGRLVFGFAANFLIRSRGLFATGPFVAASTDATSTPERILAIAAALQKRFGPLQIYVIGTSRSTEATMRLAAPLDGKVVGFVHSSSMNGIATFDPRSFTSRHLIVLHRQDACRATKPSAGEASRRSFGTALIEMEGGKSTGEDCEAFAYHGYNGIERETVDRIKAWIVAR